MPPPTDARGLLSRRRFLHASAASVLTAATAPARRTPARAAAAGPAPQTADPDFGPLDAKIQAGMARYGIPGVAVGVLAQGREYVRGYGVINVDYPVPVDGDTLFRIGSTTKTFTGTTVMRLVEQGTLAPDAPVRTYLPDFQTFDPAVAPRVTLLQLLNHSAGWRGDYYEDTGPGDDARARYAAGMARLPQLTPLGTVFHYNNAAVALAGHVIEAVTGWTYERAVRELLLEPLGLAHSVFFSDEIVGFNVAASQDVVDGRPVVTPTFWRVPRSIHPTGGLISSARDQLQYARFHLGDGTAPDGTRLLSDASLVALRSDPGPGGTLIVELDGMGVTWMLRPSAEGVRIVQHGGIWAGQHSGFLMVPERGFALTVLTNSEGGDQLHNDLFADDWALRRFAGVSNLPAVPRALSPGELAPYEGRYVAQAIGPDGAVVDALVELRGDRGQLHMTETQQLPPLDLSPTDPAPTGQESRLAFYRDDYVLVLDATGQPNGTRADFGRDADGGVAWLRLNGRLHHHVG
jgi:CubicO group peptidase (beta-lactamase class C family)